MKDKRRQVIKLTTGANALDAILGGGVETSSITELFGGILDLLKNFLLHISFIKFHSLEFRTGKTQIAHTMCVSTQLSFEMNGGQGKVIYIDTEGNFRPERIESIAERFGLDAEQTLDNIIICRVYTHEEQMGKYYIVSASYYFALFLVLCY
jgi:RecA/RadA recombinase